MAYTTPRTWTSGETPTATIMNTHLRDNMAYVYAPDDTWGTLAVNTGYQSVSGFRGVSVRIVTGTRVQLRGTLQLVTGNFGAVGNPTDFNSTSPLSASYRPGTARRFAVPQNDGACGSLDVLTTGVLRFRCGTASPTWFSLEGIEWDTTN